MNAQPKFWWIALIALALWAFAALSYAAGLTEPGVFTLADTFAIPVIVLVVLTPFSVKRIVTHKWGMPGMATWVAVTLPSVVAATGWISGLGYRCVTLSLFLGLAAFVVINGFWVWERGRDRKQDERVSLEAHRAERRDTNASDPVGANQPDDPFPALKPARHRFHRPGG